MSNAILRVCLQRYCNLIRVGFAVMFCFGFFGAASMPRFVDEIAYGQISSGAALDGTPANWVDRWVEWQDAPIGWHVGGFPFDSYHLDVRARGSVWAFEAPAFSLNLLVLSFLVISCIVATGRATNPGESKLDGSGFSNRAMEFLSGKCLSSRFRFAAFGGFVALVSAAFVRDQAKSLESLAEQVSVTTTCSVKHPLIASLPVSLRAPWTHAREIYSKRDALAQIPLNLNQHPSVRSLQLKGHVCDETWSAVGSLKLVQSLGWSGIPNETTCQDALPYLDRLVSLQLWLSYKNRDPATSESASPLVFRNFDSLRQLSVRGMRSASLASDSLGTPGLEFLDLAMVNSSGFQIELANYPQLATMYLSSLHPKANSEISIQLEGMPSLHSLWIDGTVPCDLVLKDIPRLADIQSCTTDLDDESDLEAYDRPLIRHLNIDSAASLSSLSFDVTDDANWQTRGCPNLRSVTLSMRSENTTRGMPMGPARHVAMQKLEANSESIFHWVCGTKSLNSVSLKGFRLDRVDLGKLAECRTLKSLHLERVHTKPDQLRQLTTLTSLRNLAAVDVHVRSETAKDLLEMHSSWERLELAWHTFAKVHICDQPKLLAAFSTRPMNASELTLKNLPRLTQGLVLRERVERLHLVNTPKLHAVILRHSLPKDLHLNGIDGLRQFAAQGGTLRPEHLNALSHAKLLGTLALSGCDVPRELFGQLVNWPQLNTLHLTHMQLGDEDTVNWSQLRQLRCAVLDHTPIGQETIVQLRRCPSLNSLSVQGCTLPAECIESLQAHVGIMNLRMEANEVGTNLMTDRMAQVQHSDPFEIELGRGVRGSERGRRFSRGRLASAQGSFGQGPRRPGRGAGGGRWLFDSWMDLRSELAGSPVGSM